MRIDPRFHVVVVLATASLICGSVLLFNLFVDPFGMYRLFETDGSHAAKPAAYRRVKLAKAYDLRRVEPEAIVLGTSRSHVALRMTHDGWKVPLGRRYNAAFDGATTKEMDAYLLHAHAVHPLRQVVLGLDFWQLGYGAAWTRKDFDPSILFEPEKPLHNAAVYATDLSLLVSIDTTKASIALLRNGDSGGPQWLAPDGQRLGDVFFRRIEPAYSSSPGSYFRDIDRQEIGFMLDTGPAVPTAPRKLAPAASHPVLTSFDYIAKIIEFCRGKDIDLRIFITPAHTHQLEIAKQLGGWPAIERGKRDLVDLLYRDALSHPGSAAFPLYDFEGYSSVTSEHVPPDGSRSEMRYYWDSSHFKENVGDWILDRLFGTEREGDPVPDDFGVRLMPATIDAALDKIRTDQSVYQRDQPDEVRFITSLIQQIKLEQLAAR